MFNLYGVLLPVLLLVINLRGVQSQNVTCQQDWTAYGGHCYWSVPGLKKSWNDAQSDCQSRDSNLVKIETAEENSWLETIATLSDHQWIGATDRDKEGEWRWISDNSLVSFTAWGSGEPNNVDDNEHCGHVYVGARWNDLVCSMLFGFICEKEG
uniref:C-type lectin 5 n=1 Tax=Azumapecten farreri TaxID=106299 RepID=D8VNA2_AZUFA|nr:C-type lectin 5 [Azumapecten farreri]